MKMLVIAFIPFFKRILNKNMNCLQTLLFNKNL